MFKALRRLAQGKDKIASDISCYRARVQQQHGVDSPPRTTAADQVCCSRPGRGVDQVFDLRQSSVPRSGLPRVFVGALACISMQTPGQHVFCRSICSRPGMTAWGAIRREGTQHPIADDRLFCLCAQEPPASIDRVCSASALQNGIPPPCLSGTLETTG